MVVLLCQLKSSKDDPRVLGKRSGKIFLISTANGRSKVLPIAMFSATRRGQILEARSSLAKHVSELLHLGAALTP
jgi:hypothetical protein